MRFLILGVLAILACGGRTHAAEPEVKPEDEKIWFSAKIPHSTIVFDKRLWQEVNALPSKSEQIRFLTGLLPAKDAPEKTFTARECSAFYLLGMTGSPAVSSTLIDRLEFNGEKDAHPALLALKLLGEPAVEPLVQSLQSGSKGRINLAILALQEIKGKQKFESFATEIAKRQDLKLSESTLDMLLAIAAWDRVIYEG